MPVLSEGSKETILQEKESDKLDKADKKEDVKFTNKWTEGLRLGDFYVLPEYVEIHNKLKDKKFLKEVIEKHYKDHPNVFSSVIEYGLVLIDLGKLDEARTIWNDAVKLFRSNPTPKVYKAWVDAYYGDYVASKEAWLPILKERFQENGELKFGILWLPYHIDAIIGLHLIKDHLPPEEKEEIEQLVLKVAKTFPQNPKLSPILVSHYLQNGEYKLAADNLAGILSQYPNEPVSVTLLGIAQLLTGYYDEALKLFDKAIELKSNSPTVHLMKARTLYELNKKRESNAEINIAMKLDPTLKSIEKIKLLDRENYAVSSNKL